MVISFRLEPLGFRLLPWRYREPNEPMGKAISILIWKKSIHPKSQTWRFIHCATKLGKVKITFKGESGTGSPIEKWQSENISRGMPQQFRSKGRCHPPKEIVFSVSLYFSPLWCTFRHLAHMHTHKEHQLTHTHKQTHANTQSFINIVESHCS